MNTIASFPAASTTVSSLPTTPKPPSAQAKDVQLRQAFNAFVGQTFYGQMLQAMRKTVDKPAYFHGGQGEEIFQQQLDRIVGEKLANANGSNLSGAMYKLFTMERK